jgi:hypothetical protein
MCASRPRALRIRWRTGRYRRACMVGRCVRHGQSALGRTDPFNGLHAAFFRVSCPPACRRTSRRILHESDQWRALEALPAFIQALMTDAWRCTYSSLPIGPRPPAEPLCSRHFVLVADVALSGGLGWSVAGSVIFVALPFLGDPEADARRAIGDESMSGIGGRLRHEPRRRGRLRASRHPAARRVTVGHRAHGPRATGSSAHQTARWHGRAPLRAGPRRVAARADRGGAVGLHHSTRADHRELGPVGREASPWPAVAIPAGPGGHCPVAGDRAHQAPPSRCAPGVRCF